MALSAEQGEIFELHCLSIDEPQGVPVAGIMAVETPPARFSMSLNFYILMEGEVSFPGVGLHSCMAAGTGEQSGRINLGKHNAPFFAPMGVDVKGKQYKQK